jgi:8-oxo-dGTP pyrophosphatase MutT (NUDIX family)
MPNQWSLIGGGVHLVESPEDAAIREVKEETNFLVNNITIFTKITFNSEWDAIVFYARVDSNKQKMVLHEGKELRFFPKKEALAFINHLSYSNPFLEAFRKYLNN